LKKTNEKEFDKLIAVKYSIGNNFHDQLNRLQCSTKSSGLLLSCFIGLLKLCIQNDSRQGLVFLRNGLECHRAVYVGIAEPLRRVLDNHFLLSTFGSSGCWWNDNGI